MRNGVCVPGHSISAASHQRGPAASLFPYAHLLEQTTGRLPTGSHTHYHIHTHMRLHVDMWERERAQTQTHRPTADHMYTHMAKCAHTNTHTHIHTHTVKPWHHKHKTTHSSCSPLGDIHNFLIIIFLWSLLGSFHC